MKHVAGFFLFVLIIFALYKFVAFLENVDHSKDNDDSNDR